MGNSEVAASADRTYDVIVIGGGPVGQSVAARATAAGLTVAMVEKELVGGECSYWACIPSKAMLRPVVAVDEARRLDGARQAVSGPVDAAGVFRRRDVLVSGWDDSGQAQWVKDIGADLFRGHGRVDGPRRVAVATSEHQIVGLTARHAVVVCTGSRAAIPDMPGIAEALVWTNRTATDTSTVPARLAIVGGGAVGVEMATAWQGLGSAVTLLAREPRLLPRLESFAGEMVGASLQKAGVDVRHGVTVTSMRRPSPTGPVTLMLDDGAEVEADEVLVAVGRVPLTGDIGLETVGLRPGSWLDVDDTCRVHGVDGGWLYAIGDVNHRALLTHQGKYQARIVGNAIASVAAGQALDTAAWGRHAATADVHALPQVIFSDPEVATVGLSADQARRNGREVRVVDVDMAATVAGARLFADDYQGRARMVVDSATERVLGVTFVGLGVAELLHSATVAVAGQVSISRLWHAVPPFPTVSEVWLRLLEAYRDGNNA
ncbi:NAD(P)/FAD-dependent oxidoreductase [Micromonospora sp. WMMD964]|uniref:dihydrolipoyl dehydrogenase family protein n=1 Tax=Micromonospora sp. WMMD964 TaxID=3016091 RepID=UPI00249CB05D|nr:NAD(P)/FAD-dependent oxidoreductase [Micromonospora sp. WMMD964]WFF00224.1 NAD(P)/FAD-dependent oxidoreductase [Micromonospora sp. WMMD964]